MTDYPWTTREQAELLKELVDSFVGGRPWSVQQRKDARILVGLLIDYSREVELAQRVDRRLREDSEGLPT